MRILLTGASGFLGKVIQKKLGAKHELITLGRGESNHISSNLATTCPKLPKVDMVIHAAGKAHVIPKSEQEAKEFFQVNLEGTRNLLEGLKDLPQSFVFISTVAVYGLESGENIPEDYPLLGETPYAKSKIEAEKLLLNWGKENGVQVVILRLPLIVGPNPPGNLGAIIRAIGKGIYFRLGKGESKKSMVLASDVAELIPSLIDHSGIYNLTDGVDPSLAQLDTKIAQVFGKKVRSFPESLLNKIAKIGDLLSFFPLNSYRVNKLSQTLTFSSEKAKEELNWSPRSVLNHLFEE